MNEKNFMLRNDLKTLLINLLSGFAVYVLAPGIGLIAIGAGAMAESFTGQLALMPWVWPAGILIGSGMFFTHYVIFIMRFDKKLATLTQRIEELRPSSIAKPTQPDEVELFEHLAFDLESAKMARRTPGVKHDEEAKKRETTLFVVLGQLGIARSEYADSEYGDELVYEYWMELQHLSEQGTAAALEHARRRWPLLN